MSFMAMPHTKKHTHEWINYEFKSSENESNESARSEH